MLSTITEILKGQRLGSAYEWLAGLVFRICMAGLVFRVCMGVRIFRGSKYHVTGPLVVIDRKPNLWLHILILWNIGGAIALIYIYYSCTDANLRQWRIIG